MVIMFHVVRDSLNLSKVLRRDNWCSCGSMVANLRFLAAQVLFALNLRVCNRLSATSLVDIDLELASKVHSFSPISLNNRLVDLLFQDSDVEHRFRPD